MTTSNLDKFFSPKSIAVIGASKKSTSVGFSILKNVVDFGFQGEIYAINPKAESVYNIKSYPNLKSIEKEIDLAIIAIPAKFVIQVVQEAIDLKIKHIIVITAGFKEIGNIEEEEKLINLGFKHNVRILGPNCMGLINSHSPMLNATFSPKPLIKNGEVGFISSSGALGVVVMDYAYKLQLGFSKFVSLGNASDVSVSDVILNMGHDATTKVILGYIESFTRPKLFYEYAKSITKQKPILIVKSGRTDAGAKAASSHTGALASDDRILNAVFDSTGILRLNSIEDMFNCALAFTKCPLPKGKNVAVITNAGGPGTLMTDSLVNKGLNLGKLQAKTIGQLESFLPKEASSHNPIDILASGGVAEYSKCLKLVLDDEHIDSVVIIMVFPPLTINGLDIMRSIDDITKKSSKPVLYCIMGGDELIEQGLDLSFPIYRYPDATTLSLSTVTRYAIWKREPIVNPELRKVASNDIKGIIPSLVSKGESTLDQSRLRTVLEAYGFQYPKSEIIHTKQELDSALLNIEFPVVLKMGSIHVEHKTDEGGVFLNIKSVEELNLAWNSIQHSYSRLKVPNNDKQIIIQEFFESGVEIALGIVYDKQFGSICMIGSGGILIELFDDVQFGMAPLSRSEAKTMIKKLRGNKLLTGFRGSEPVDLDSLEDAILNLSTLAFENPNIIELDINPLLLFDKSKHPVVIDARIRIDTI